jgi:hypothetical protein
VEEGTAIQGEQVSSPIAQNLSSPRRGGRKPANESRADELRERLLKWSYFPASARPSLRVLAKALQTNHQLLSHLLVGLEEWEREKDLARCRVLSRRAGVVWTEADGITIHLKFRRTRRRIAQKWDPRREARHGARVEALMNAVYAKFRLTPPPRQPKDPMAMWTTPPEGLDTWRMLWSE